MKKILCLSVLMSLPLSAAYSAPPKKVHQLPTQTIDVLPAHLTTRIQWSKFPQPNYSNQDLKEKNRAAIIRIFADAHGEVQEATVEESTGIQSLDQLLLRAVEKAEVKPHIDADGKAAPQIGYQAFNLKLTAQDAKNCDFEFNSKVWQAQQNGKKTAFQYAEQPPLELNTAQLKEHDRKIKFSFKTDKHGSVKKVKIKQGSGIYALDQQVIQAVSGSQIKVKRTASTLWMYKKSSFKDEIQFKLNECKSS